jgi:DNA-binding LacI/PurR family transcriptional regulator
MLPMLSHPVFAECLQGIETAAQNHNHVVAVRSSGYRPESEERSSEVLLQQRVDAIGEYAGPYRFRQGGVLID